MKLPRALSEIAPKLAQARAAYSGLATPPAPMNLTYSVTNQCNSRCQSCDIWKIYPAQKERLVDELTLGEVDRIFSTVGRVYFFNISGGEPFLRPDLEGIIEAAVRHLKPSVVHIPTNGLMPARVERRTEGILRWMQAHAPGTKLTLKPSFDGVGARHDEARGIPGNFARLTDTLDRLSGLRRRYPALRVGVGTVIRQGNVDQIPEIIAFAEGLDVDTYISEIAEQRVEMGNVGRDGLTPDLESYQRAIVPFKAETARRIAQARGMDRLTLAMRYRYYDLTVEWLREQRQVIPCYAGITHAHISAYGELWACAVRGDEGSLGNLKQHGYDFQRVWASERAAEVRRSIKAGECHCPLANQAYGNMLLSPRVMADVAAKMVAPGT